MRMAAVKPWAKGLNISEDQLLQWTNDAPGGMSLLFWCIVENKIPVDQYLQWARDHYGLPSLNSKFFSTTANKETFEKHSSLHNWTQSAFPVAEWDDLVFVACAEPIEKEQWEKPVHFVLASPIDLQQCWNNFSGVATGDAEEMSEKTFSSIPPTPEIHVVTGETDDLSNEIPESSTDTPQAPAEAAAPPAGEFKIEVPQVSKKFELQDEVSEEQEEAPPAYAPDGMDIQIDAAAAQDVPEGMMANPTSGIKLDLSNIGPASSEPKAEEKPQAEEPTVAPEAKPIETPESEMKTGSLKIDVPQLNLNSPNGEAPKLDLPAAPEGATPELPATPESATPDVPDDSTMPIGTSTSTNTAGLIVTDTAPLKIEQATTEADVTAFVFKELRNEYDACMVLTYKGEELQPWKWDENWKPVDGADTKAIELKVPSAFRIVHRTKLPYHGHVVDSEYNNNFFKSWGIDNIPETLTIVPLKQDESFLFGMLLCIGSKKKNNNSVLVLAERCADELLASIGKAGKVA